jgi:YVTN family beta-propeller protein
VIDGQTDSVITTITVGSGPNALVWNSQNNKIYCANYNDNSVTVIDGQTNSVITTIAVGSHPFALVWNFQNNKVYCANDGSNNVTVIDGQTDSVITNITVGTSPRAFCWNSTQNRVYVANYNSSNVAVIRDSIVSGVAEDIENCKLKIDNFSVYPNPAKTYFTIRLPLSADRTEIKIFDVTGNIVKSEELKGKTNRLSLKGIKPGVYFLQLNNEPMTKKLVITQ